MKAACALAWRAQSARRNARGATLIEILVALVILLFGLLGLTGLSGRAHMMELESVQRVQALQLLQDMSERLNANRQAAACYSQGTAGRQLGTGVSWHFDAAQCPLGDTAQVQQAAADLQAWDALIKGASVVLTSDTGAPERNVGAMIGALGCISQVPATDNAYLIAVAWQGLVPTAAPRMSDGSIFPCGKDAFADERLHRVVTTKVLIGKLGVVAL